MRFETTFTAEPAGTFRASKWFRTSMTDQMLPKIAAVIEGFAALWAEKWPIIAENEMKFI